MDKDNEKPAGTAYSRIENIENDAHIPVRFCNFGLTNIRQSFYLMITRMVRMQFRADALAAFEAIFAASKHQIRNFPGCMALELHHDPADPSVRYTWSRWASEEALLAYRQSPIFGQVWPATKALFASPPQAFSMVLEEVIPGSPGQN